MNLFQNRSNWLFPLVLAVVLGGVSFWLDRISDVKTIEIPLNPSEPKYIINTIHGERFDEQGRLNEYIVASSAHQFPQQSVVYIAQPDLTIYADGAPLYYIKAQQGQYHTDSRLIDLIDQVSWYKNARPGDPEAQLDTRILHVDPKTQTVKTDAPVSYQYGLSHGTAQGFEYNKQRGFLNLDSRVRAIIYDPKKH